VSDTITIARAHEPRVVMAKILHLDTYGIADVEPSPHAFLWAFEQVPVGNLHQLGQALATAAADPYAVAVRAKPLLPIGRRAIYPEPDYGEHAEPGLVATPRRWVAFDMDNVPDANTPEDDPAEQPNWDRPPALFMPEIGVAIAKRRLPPAFREACCIWQVTASAGFKPGYRLRLWYWLDAFVTGRELEAWCQPAIERALLDPVTLRDCQEHYIGVHVIGGADPCPARWGIAQGATHEVKVPDIAGIKRRQDEAERKARRTREAGRTYSIEQLTGPEYARRQIAECIAAVKNATEQTGRHPTYLKQCATAKALCDRHGIDWARVRQELSATYEGLFSPHDAARRRRGSIEGVPDWLDRRAS
jgi:hypothetical protein